MFRILMIMILFLLVLLRGSNSSRVSWENEEKMLKGNIYKGGSGCFLDIDFGFMFFIVIILWL